MNSLIFQTIVILLPGFVWVKLEEMSTRTGGWHNYERLVRSVFYGLLTYIVLYWGYRLCGVTFTTIDMSANGTSRFLSEEHFDEVAWSVPVAFVLATFWSYAKNRKLIIRLFQRIKVTKKFGDEDVWDYLFNSPTATTEYIHLRDFENEWVYCGWVVLFSDDKELRELYLRDVVVYDFSGEKIMQLPSTYLSRKADSINIEFPYIHIKDEKKHYE